MINYKFPKEPVCGIYKITNLLNNKVYIGQSIDIRRRWQQHKSYKGNLLLRNAIKKYGIENFQFNIIEIINTTGKSKNHIIEELIQLEQKWFDLIEPSKKEIGYNILKTSLPNIGGKRNQEFGDKISKIKIDNNHCGKKILQYDLNGTLIKTWKSAAEIERILGYKAENIGGCCLRKQKTSNFFMWRFENDTLTNEEIEKANSTLRMSEVRQYNLEGELIRTFTNIKEAALITGFSEKNIRHGCSEKIKTSMGYIWRHKNNSIILENHIHKPKSRKINQLDRDGNLIKQWSGLQEIILELQFSKTGAKDIYSVINGKREFYKKYKWEYAE